MVLEEQRGLHEDLERLEQAIADRVIEDPKNIRERLNRDHQVASFLDRIHDQSQRLLAIYKDTDASLAQEVQKLATGDPFEAFYKEYNEIKGFHQRYPNEPVENLERAYKRRVAAADGEPVPMETDSMFTGEEGYGRFFDLTTLHDLFINLPGVRGARRLTYLQYLDAFDAFAPPLCPIKRPDKMTDEYLRYLGALAEYLEGFLRRIRPLDDMDRLFASFDADFETAWAADEVVGWEKQTAAGPADPSATNDGEGIWCADCEREFKSASTYQHHLTQKKHQRAAQARKARAGSSENGPAPAANGAAHGNGSAANMRRLQEKAVAAREQRVARLAAAMQTERADTRVNVERRQGMTEREREQELAALLAADDEARADAAALAASADGPAGAGADDDDDDPDAKIYNPLKLPLGWDGKPIPFWLYKLHGLGVELPCEICGNFVYMGRRAFDKHFNEPRHVHGLRCLGINGNTTLFRDITGIEDALKLWDKMTRDRKREKTSVEGVVQMEDGEGNVMPEKVYNDLRKQGLL